MEFAIKDFERILLRRDHPEYKGLVNKVGDRWKSLWSEYLEWFEKERGRKMKLDSGDRAYWGHKGEHLVRFLEHVLDNEEQRKERIILIFLTSRLREGLRKELDLFGPEYDDLSKKGASTHLGLCWLLLHWRDQAYSICEEDALTSALIRMEIGREIIAWAEIGHARRMRSGIGSPKLRKLEGRGAVELKKVQISERLLSDAKRLLPVDKKEQIEQFCYIHPDALKPYIELQRALNLSRRGSQREAADKAMKLLEDDTFVLAPSNFNSHSNSYLKWWCFHILIRASSASLDEQKFSKFKEEMMNLEDSLPEDFKKYFHAFHVSENPQWTGRMCRDEEASMKAGTDQLIKAFRNWKNFYGNWWKKDKDTPDSRRFTNGGDTVDYRSKYVRGRPTSHEWKKFCGEKRGKDRGATEKRQSSYSGFHTFHIMYKK